ncbi:hypothetical protein QTA58_06825 [Neorhizobium sp. CSC1952]|uniref:DUF6894 family protein n=1 Tax=Neorhizobium sp. CSC1952 TaxID=2978974 RepID=UPI0025A5F0F9|nr:hypothetical protein [Rhizobium sp. CSC1952]WJR68460.1 hypothetical protein QTA58_06825 [Rhizobium sp. CSC1952]
MTRYFFQIRRGGVTITDEEGDEFDSIDEAHANAIGAVRELLAARIKNGAMILDEHMEIRDETGALVIAVSFHDVIKRHLGR